MSWIRLREVNQWNVISYSESTVLTRTLNGHGLIKLEERSMPVRWPDGTTEYIDLKSVKTQVDTYDMGSTHKTEQTRFGFWTKVHGLLLWVDICGVEVRTDYLGRNEP